MKTARCFPLAVLVLLPLLLLSQTVQRSVSSVRPESGLVLSAALQQKVASGRLLQHIAQKYAQARTMGAAVSQSFISVAMYASEPPSLQFLAELEARGVRAFADTWIPPLKDHPMGFFLAQIPVDKVAEVLGLDAVKKMETAESGFGPLSNQAAHVTHADAVWEQGWTGTGVKVGVIDSGLDLSFAGSELPGAITVMDYSNYPALDTIVNNTITGHGTQVAGLILGRGTLSASNTGNGGGAYKGMAPDASLVFLKVGRDNVMSFSDVGEIKAIRDAADVYHVNLLNLSAGGWDAYHDGSSEFAQAIDYAYSRGVACFVAAGNSGAWARHASGSAPPSGMSAFIPVKAMVTGTPISLAFNLVWADGADRNNLSLHYYDNAKNPLSLVWRDAATESPRGTESQLSRSSDFTPNPEGIYYVRVENPSSVEQAFHIYEDNNGRMTFVDPDPNFTITTPGDADHAFTVGAYTSRDVWTAWDGSSHSSGEQTQHIAPFSSRGPRIDGMMKPNITAPGSMIVSLRDRDVLTSDTYFCIDNDGTTGAGAANYYVDRGTSFAAPVCTGAAALILQHSPGTSPQQIYDAIMLNAGHDSITGLSPSPTWGYGKLDVHSALVNIPLPVELASFTASLRAGTIALNWRTASEVNNYGFEIEKREVTRTPSGAAPSAQRGWSKIGFVAGSGASNSAREYGFVDKPAQSGTYAYRLKQIDRDGRFTYSPVVEAAANAAPIEYSLSQNFPNPFNPSTTLRFTIAAAAKVRLTVFDLLGREVAVLADRQMEPGKYSVEWNAGALPSGVYFYRLDAANFSSVKKLLLQK